MSAGRTPTCCSSTVPTSTFIRHRRRTTPPSRQSPASSKSMTGSRSTLRRSIRYSAGQCRNERPHRTRGHKEGILTTEGFQDVTHIDRHRKSHNFSLQQTIPWQKRPLVERRHSKKVHKHIQPPGEVVAPLDENVVRAAAEKLVTDGVESVVVYYLHAYLDPSHEQRTTELLAESFPDLSVSTSHGVVAQFREFERFATTVVDARLASDISAYLGRLSDQLADRRPVRGARHAVQRRARRHRRGRAVAGHDAAVRPGRRRGGDRAGRR